MLNSADVREIEALAQKLQGKTAFAPPNYSVSVGGVDVQVTTPAHRRCPPGGVLNPGEFRADYLPNERKIQADCGFVTIPPGHAEFEHLVRVLGHEALHALQHDSFDPQEINKAVSLGHVADLPGALPKNYEDYITCDVELPAHAVMIALELRGSQPATFEADARTTVIVAYFEHRLAGLPSRDATLDRLIASAKPMHAQL